MASRRSDRRARLAASCFPTVHSSGRRKSMRCASYPNSCSSIAAIWRPTTRNNLFKPINYNRAEFASGVAHALIKGGVRCVIAAGWAVDDDAASIFATSFYKALLGGDRFIDAVAAARERRARTRRQHLGGVPVLRRSGLAVQDADRRCAKALAAGLPRQEFASIASAPALIIALERIAVESEYQGKKPEAQAARLRYLEAEVRPILGKTRRRRGSVRKRMVESQALRGGDCVV